MKAVRLLFPDARSGAMDRLVGPARGPLGWAGLIALAIAVVVAAVVAWQWMAVRQQFHATRAAIEQSASRQRPLPVADKPALSADAMRGWNLVVRHLNTPWSTLLAALERATPDDVALVSIEPDAQLGSIRLQAEARSLDQLLAFVQQLESNSAFASVSPLKHETNEQEALRPLRMTIALRLKEMP
jgi:Tfp pilus assembly protein PilN